MNAVLPIRHQLSGLEQLARISGWRPGTIIVLTWGHFDESGEHDTSGKLRRLTMGGFFAPWSSVQALCDDWRAALQLEGLGSFHMKEIASDEHNYANWPADRRNRLNRFVDILCEHATLFGAFSYEVRNPRNAFVQAYQPGLARTFIELEKVCVDSNQRGSIVFAQTDEISNALIGRYFDISNWANWFDGYAVRRASNEPALQAAEIVARGMRRLMQDGGITHSFGRVLASGKQLRFWPPDPFAALLVPWRYLGGDR